MRRLLTRAAERSTKEVYEHQDLATPTKRFRSPSLMFARILKTRPEFKGLGAEEATRLIDQEAEAIYPGHPAPWVALGLPDVDSRGESRDPRLDFLMIWDDVSTPYNLDGGLERAAARARAAPFDVGEDFSHPGEEKFRRVISLCYWMGHFYGGKFSLSCLQIQDALDIDRTTASTLRKLAIKRRFLEAEPYTAADRGKRLAMEYRFIADEPGSIRGRSSEGS